MRYYLLIIYKTQTQNLFKESKFNRINNMSTYEVQRLK